jgi:T5SS/PEP-CTERM-associated repeat protein/autotransporter-associated beta strand protein
MGLGGGGLNSSFNVRLYSMNFPKLGRAAFLGASVVGLLMPATVAQATNYWKYSVFNGTWSNGNNWSATSASGVDNAGAPTPGEAVNIAFIDGLARNVTYDVTAPSLGLLSIDLVELSGPSTVAHTLLMPGNNSLAANGIYVGGYNGSGPTNGRGALHQSGGYVATTSGWDLVVGHGANSTGTYTLSGGALEANQSEFIGFRGTGTFNHTDGTNTVNASAVGAFDLGGFAGATGTYNLGGAGALTVNAHEYIGDSGTGIFNQTGGTHTIAAGKNLYLGFNASGRGEYNLSGGTLNAHAVFVGYAGSAPSNFLITGAGSRVNATTSFVVGRAGFGALTLADGGTLSIGNGTLPLLIGTVGGGVGYVNIGNGGAAGVLEASAVAFGLAGQLFFDHTDNLAFATPITGPGNVLKYGAGTTTLSAPNSYTGGTSLNGGTLAISADGNLGTAPSTFKPTHLELDRGTLRATQSFTLAATRGIYVTSRGGTIEVDATKTLTYPNNLDLSGGSMTKTGAGTLALANLTLGDGASSSLIVAGGGTLASGNSVIGEASNVDASATVSGPGTAWTTNYFTVGNDGNGTLEIVDGATVAANTSFMAFYAGSTGTVTVRGAGSTWNAGYSLQVGNQGNATLNIEDQGLVDTGTLDVEGAVNLTGGTLRFNGYVRGAAGKINFTAGAIQLVGDRSVGTDAAIADFFGDVPAIPTGKGLTVELTATLSKPLTINGGAFKTNSLVIGAGGALDFDRGLLELTGGAITGLASLTVPTNGEFRASGVQSLRITGAAGSTITATGNLTLGDAAAVNGFGTQGTLQVGANGVTLLDANDVVFDSLALATLGAGGSPGTLNAANGLTLDFGGNVTGFGAVSTPNNVAKPLINNGHITGNSVAQRITLPGYVKGVGTFDNVIFTGTFSPGLSPTSLIVGNVALSPTSTLVMELGGAAPGSGFDQLQSSAAIAFDGTLLVSLINGFSPAAGQSFNLFDWASTSGTFDALQLPTLAGALAWNTSQLYTTGVLSVAPAFTADFDKDGDVDGDDLAQWTGDFGLDGNSDADADGDSDGGDFLAWQQQLGSGGSPMAPAAAGVPEPGALALASLAVLGGALRCRPRRKDQQRRRSIASQL